MCMNERPERTAESDVPERGSNEQAVVFEGETLSNSPQLARRFAGWISRRFE